MDQNPYQPPRARMNPRTREPGSIAKAVVVGAIIDIGGTMLGGIVLALAYSILMGLQGHSNAEVEQALTQFDRWSLFGLLLTGMGLTMSLLGGYQCAVVANRNTYLAPGILSLVSVSFGASLSGPEIALSELLLLSCLTVAAILSGASFYIRKLMEPPASPSAER